MTDMVERVARALWDQHGATAPWDKLPPLTRSVYKRQALAAIRAMREPTDEMNDAMADICDGDRCRRGFMAPVFNAGIEAALKGGDM